MLNYTYLASKEEITTINENDVAQYDYIAVFYFGSGDPQVMEKEKNLMRSTLARFMRSKCLIVSYDELLKVDSSHFLKSHYNDFITPSISNLLWQSTKISEGFIPSLSTRSLK